MSMIARFGTAQEVTLDELRVQIRATPVEDFSRAS
jgi:hypothetical protein